VSIDAPSSAKVGDLVSFGAQASDATSGVAGGFDWSFGDTTGGATGDAVNHTFTQAGTYEVRAKTLDGAGNQGTATKVVTVPAAGTGGGGTPGGGAQGGSDDGTSAAALDVTAPRKLKAKAKSLPLTPTADTPGKASFALVRSGRVIARGSKALDAGTTTYKLKLPRKVKAGRYVLKVTFTPAGGRATTTTRKVTLTGKAKARKARASAAAHGARVSGAGAPVGLPNGVFHGERKRSFVPRVR
jgi:hypothetical protein